MHYARAKCSRSIFFLFILIFSKNICEQLISIFIARSSNLSLNITWNGTNFSLSNWPVKKKAWTEKKNPSIIAMLSFYDFLQQRNWIFSFSPFTSFTSAPNRFHHREGDLRCSRRNHCHLRHHHVLHLQVLLQESQPLSLSCARRVLVLIVCDELFPFPFSMFICQYTCISLCLRV